MNNIILAEIDATKAATGYLYNADMPQAGEMRETVLKDWFHPIYHPKWSPYRYLVFLPDEGEMALQCIIGGDEMLLTRQDDFTDSTVTARIRFLNRLSAATPGNGRVLSARTGLLLRFQDMYRYYFFCCEEASRFVLYRRDDMVAFHELGQYTPPEGIDQNTYYELALRAEGDKLVCSVDGQPVIEACDSHFRKGSAGLVASGLASFKSVRVTTDEAGNRHHTATREAARRELDAAREAVPQMELARTIRFPFAVRRGLFADLRNTGTLDYVCLRQRPEGGWALQALTAKGEVIWQHQAARVAGLGTAGVRVADVDGDGNLEVVSLLDGFIRLYEGATGRLKAETPLPPVGPMMEHMRDWIDENDTVYAFFPAQLRRAPHPRDILLMDNESGGGWNIWAYDERLNLRFHRTFEQPPFGHTLFLHDIDGDGREEIAIGQRLLNGDGQDIWTMEGAKLMDLHGPGRHADDISLGWRGDDPSAGYFAALSVGDDGFYLLNGADGKVISHHLLGHVQGHSIGKFRRDVPGLQVICGTRHRGYGVCTVISSNGVVLHRFQPDFRSPGGPPCNWAGEGEELMSIFYTEQAAGLWDSYGRLVVPLPDAEKMFSSGAPVSLAPQPLLGEGTDDIALVCGDTIRVYTANRRLAAGERIYAPQRDVNRQITYVSFPAWARAGESKSARL